MNVSMNELRVIEHLVFQKLATNEPEYSYDEWSGVCERLPLLPLFGLEEHELCFCEAYQCNDAMEMIFLSPTKYRR